MTDPSHFLPRSELATPIVRYPGEGHSVGVVRGRTTFKVLPEETDGAYAVLEQVVPPGGGPPLHVHRHETELFYVLSGEFEVTVASQTIRAVAGTFVAGPRDIPHRFRNVGTTDARLLLTVIPGRFANYFLDVDGIPDHDLAAITALCARYDVQVLPHVPASE
jgi:quercetin dioxygenase-like cupin family protein